MSTKEKNKELIEKLRTFAADYRAIVIKSFDDRWSKVNQEIYNKHISEAIGALLARQCTLSIKLAEAPLLWDGHVSPLFLRCMADAHITLAWILSKPEERSMKYVMYGLGQEKLYISHLEEEVEKEFGSSESPDKKSMQDNIELRKQFLNAQLSNWSIEIKLGSWSEKSVREMAEEIDESSFYKHVYAQFSGGVHNMWHDVKLFNTAPCSNPMHKWHRVPQILDNVNFDMMYMHLSSKYLSKTLKVFDEKMGVECSVQSPQEFFEEFFSSEFEDDN